MSFARKILNVTAPLALLAATGCATGLPTQVSRFQAMPAPAGQTFFIQPTNEANRGGLEFSRYADLVRQSLAAEGYTPATSAADANLLVSLDYGVDNGRTEVRSIPGAFGRSRFGYGPFGYGGFGYRPYYSRFGYYRSSPFYYGWNDPFLFGGFDDVRSYTVYTSYVDVDIRDRSGRAVFEGSAKARSRTDELPRLVPNLVEAVFTGFPGRSGETVRITVPTERRR
ncbi:MAG TPA: DUF4136 domain-containing protein [Sphingomonadaceae bacterium]|nr:DUF4136 domain-containing protein [Sphingomonadaceae bacterium]